MSSRIDGNQAQDAELLRRVGLGNSRALSELYERHGQALYTFAFRMTGSRETAEDVVQNCFLTLLDAPGFDPARGPLRAYLFGVARNQIRKGWRRDSRFLGVEPVDSAGEAGSPLRDLLQSELAARVRRSVLRLPAAQREALVLFDYLDLSLKEIAEITRSALPAVKGRLYRARQSLRRELEPYLARNSGLQRKKAR